MNEKKTIRVRVKTNKFIDMIVAIEPDKTVRELAHRVLHCFHELAEEHIAIPPKRRDLAVSAIKVGNYHISKSEIIGNLVNDNDEIQCTLSKAKPKFPNCPKAYQIPPTLSKYKPFPSHENAGSKYLFKTSDHFDKPNQSKDQKRADKKKAKRQKKRQKMMQQQQQINKSKIQNVGLQQQQQLDEDAYIIYKPKTNEPQQLVPPDVENPQPNCEDFSINKLTNFLSHEEQIIQVNQFIQEKPHIDLNSLPQNIVDISTLDKTFCIPPVDTKQTKLNIQAKKDQIVGFISTIKPEQPKKKKPNFGSILQILSRTAQEKDRKAKRKDKKNEKSEDIQTQIKLTSSTQVSFNQNQKPHKNQKECSGNKIASPKVTFHNSPMLSPQVININSPKRKISNPSIEKLDLENVFDISGRGGKKQVQKQKKVSQKQQQESKKQVLTAAPSKIIVEEDSDSQQSGQINIHEDEKQTEQVSSKLAALDARISKYRLQFFDGSDEDQ